MESNWNINERQLEFRLRRETVKADYDNEVRQLQRELSAKIDRLKMEKYKKLNAIDLDAARFADAYRKHKEEREAIVSNPPYNTTSKNS